LRASELGAKVALVERANLGGTCTNDGCVPTRVLAHAARLARESEQFAEFGLVGEPARVDFDALLKRTQKKVYSLHEKKQLIDHLESAGVTIHLGVGAVQFTDPQAVLASTGLRLEAQKFILCAGGHARRLSFPGSDLALTHSDVWSLKRRPESVIIIGAAGTGCQLASIFEAFGSRVILLEIGTRILGMEDQVVSDVVQQAFEDRGMEITTGIGGVERIERDGRDIVVWYAHQEQAQQARAEAVIMAAGWPGNAEGLNLAVAGVQHGRGYVVVDEYLRTSAPHIFAAGDITGRMMLVQSAGYEARVAAENAVLGVGQPYTHKIVPHGGFTDPEYGSVGLTEERARALEPECVVSVIPYSAMDRAVIDGHLEGSCKLIVSRETHRILGAHVVGEQALEIIQLVAAGMAADMWVEQLAELELAYPTYTAIIGLAARDLVRELGVMPLTPQWRALGRRHAAEWERTADNP
jgi:pyruvate/2-oxoglutarate dehydrogenase complex dihydrolipoamide dehydrogenase (E3) component